MNLFTQKKRTIKTVRLELLVASLIVLLQELALIRYLPTQVRVLAYFPNLILISAFLGLGVGCLRAEKRSLLWLWPVSLLFIIICAYFGSRIAFTQESASEHLWLLYQNLPRDAPIVHGVKIPIIIGFFLCCISFIPLGQIVAERLQEFKKLSSSLWGYCWDITGSLLGVITFSILGFLQVFPVLWFLGLLALGFLFFYSKPYLNVVYLVVVLVICLFVNIAEKAMFYSPYYAISFYQDEDRIRILTNGSLHQVALSLQDDIQSDDEFIDQVRKGYHLPYRFLKKRPKKALVIGAGTGNDVSVLLDEGVESIDAVEIDPLILELGRKHHPDQPYSSNRVNIINADARSFLNYTREKYDIIIFGTLDSMTRLSALSNVRLDNFVYTVECINKAKECLTSDGGLIMYFMTGTPFIHHKLNAILTISFDQLPFVVSKYYYLFNTIYMAGPAFEHCQGESRKNFSQDFKEQALASMNIPTDDWPYLYLTKREISNFYLSLIGVLIIIAYVLILLSSGDMRKSFLTGRRIDIQMFLFGFAFLLLESRYVTQMNLAWGATWITSAVVFGSILFMVLISTIFHQLRPIPFKVSFIGLATALTITYLLPVDLLIQQNPIIKILISILYVGTPIFFAGTSFAYLFEKRERADNAFGWNLIGAVTGGLAEFITMMAGFRAMLLLALLIYLIAFLSYIRERANQSTNNPNKVKKSPI